MSGVLTLLTTVLAGGDVCGAVSGHVLTLAMATLHGLRAIAKFVLALAARAHERVGTLIDVVALLAAVATAHRAGIRALLGEMAFLFANTAFARRSILRLRTV